MNHEDHREVLATDKLCLNLLSLLIHLVKIMSFHAICAHFILHFLFILLTVLFSKRWVFRGASCGGTVRSRDSMKVEPKPELSTQNFTDVVVRILLTDL